MSANLLAEFDSFYQIPSAVHSQTHLERPQQQTDLPVINHAGLITQPSGKTTDLWDFGDFDTTALTQKGSPPAPLQTIGSSTAVPNGKEATDDDWGDFESGENVGETAGRTVSQDRRYGARGVVSDSFRVVPAHLGSNKPSGEREVHKSFTPVFQGTPTPAFTSHLQLNRSTDIPTSVRPPRDENVLFDAEEDLDDEFGDFEAAQEDISPPALDQGSQNLHHENPKSSLIDLEASFGNTHLTPMFAEPNPSLRSWTPTESLSKSMDAGSNKNSVTAKILGVTAVQPSTLTPANDGDDTWDEFTESLPITRPLDFKQETQNRELHRNYQQPSVGVNVDDGAWDDFDESVPGPQAQVDTRKRLNGCSILSTSYGPVITQSETAADSKPSSYSLNLDTILPQRESGTASPPPSNIPPPALLLPLFHPIIGLAQTQLLEPLASPSNSPATRDAILANPETRTFLASYLAIGNVLARIIAGRKLRWKRDTLLAQSMRIGPASTSGKSGGMKLAGIDRGENVKEEREVADVLKLWRAQLGRLRSAVAGAGSIGTVPEIVEASMVRTAKENEGAMSSPKACALCGLKRNERIAKIDLEVLDSFGEWWVEHWGHRTCMSFWDVHQHNLVAR